MTPEEKDSLKAVAPKLKILDVILVRSQFNAPGEPAPESTQAWQQHKRGVQYGITEPTEDGHQELQVKVELGTRVLISNDADGQDGAVQFEIEADFVVRYQMSEPLEEAALDAFSNFNSVHNVWPFWRQHVFDIVQRGRLPHVDVPLFAGAKA